MSRKIGINGISTDDNGNIIIENNLILNGGMVLPPAINVTLNTNTNNLLIPGLSNGVLIRITTTGNFNLTGIVPPDITQGGLIFVANVGNNNLILKNNDAGSSANNRFIMGGDKTVQSGEAAIFVYDTISLRYRLFSVNI